MITSTLYNAAVSLAAKLPQSIMLPPPCFTAATLFLCTSGHCSQTIQSFSQLTMKSPCPQLWTVVKHEAVDFRAGASFMDSILSVHVKLAWLESVFKLMAGQCLNGSWVVHDHVNQLPLSWRVTVWVFFHNCYITKWLHLPITCMHLYTIVWTDNLIKVYKWLQELSVSCLNPPPRTFPLCW